MCCDLLGEPVCVGEIAAFCREGDLTLGVVTQYDVKTCGVRTYWVRRGRVCEADLTIASGTFVLVPKSRLTRDNEIHERLIQESQECQH